jgi:hypothetical protein
VLPPEETQPAADLLDEQQKDVAMPAKETEVAEETATTEQKSINPYASYYDVRTWKVAKNSDLKEVLSRWSEEVDVDLNWQLEGDYKVGYMVWVDGTFEQAVKVLFKGYENQSGVQPSAVLELDSPDGPTLHVKPSA